MASNLITEPYLAAWAKWFLYRKRRLPERYRTMWTWRHYVQWCSPGGVLVDCGANVGDVTAMLLRKHFTVHAFEPDPVAVAAMTARFGHLPNLNIHSVAVGAHAGIGTLHRSPTENIADTTRSSLFEFDVTRSSRSIDVPVIDLFAFIADLPRQVTILKLDVEGAEFEILERMLDEHAWQDIEHIFVEAHTGFSPNFVRRCDLIRDRIKAASIHNVHFGWV